MILHCCAMSVTMDNMFSSDVRTSVGPKTIACEEMKEVLVMGIHLLRVPGREGKGALLTHVCPKLVCFWTVLRKKVFFCAFEANRYFCRLGKFSNGEPTLLVQ